MKPYLCAAVVAALASGAVAQQGARAMRTISSQGRTRNYLLHVPASPNGALVLVFHGGGGSPFDIESQTHFDDLSDREHFLVAYPEGFERSWADGRGTTKADREGLDDVALAKAIVSDIATTTHAVDRARVYATGPSNGGIFTNRLGCDAADVFAAIAPVIGTLAEKMALRCRPAARVSVVGVQGVADPVVPFDGGEVGGTIEAVAAGGRVQSSRATQELWRTVDGCGPTPTSTPLPARVDDGTSVTKRAYSGCRDATDVVWYEIAGGGHRWPPNHSPRPMVERAAAHLLGSASQNIDASAVIWSFFAAHTRK